MTNLIHHYIQRQRIVIRALIDISPRLLMMIDDATLKKSLEPYIVAHEEKINSIGSQSGVWETWQYWLHGIGCRLTHIQTQEPLEWDAPYLNGFRFDWFWNHLIWRIRNEPQDALVSQYLKLIYTGYSEIDIFPYLGQLGVIKTKIDGISFLVKMPS
jgi:hypothetical protein